MVPSPNLLQPDHLDRDASFVGPAEITTDADESYICRKNLMIRSQPFSRMADDESRASIQKEIREDIDMEGWLQLSLGSHVPSPCSSDAIDEPEGLARPATHVATTSSSIQYGSSGGGMNFRQQLEAAWRSYWHGPWINPDACSSSSRSQIPQEAYTRANFLSIDDMRVVDPPLRPPSGLWFVLQAAQNQEKVSFLPQLPKNYLRVRDGRSVTVVLLMKYLSSKLGLNNESQVEITCKEQKLQPWMTLQHVRDKIWCSSSDDATPLSTYTPAAEHLMILQYCKKT